jgi:nucleotide-binding universal stress UspA family protein
MNLPTDPAYPAILLATDLTPRSDRALDRALLLARLWQAPLVALAVLPSGPSLTSSPMRALSTDAVAERARLRRAERRLQADLAGLERPARARVEQGEVVPAVLAVAQAERCGLIVTGVARREALARALSDSTVDKLARRALAPLLVVRERARGPYAHVLVTSDFSDHARHALMAAVALFPQARYTLFHAFDNPYPLMGGLDSEPARQGARAQAEERAQAFLAATPLPESVRARIGLQLVHGDVGLLVRQHGTEHLDDLVVLGTQRRTGLAGMLLGSVAERVLELARNDVLLVPPAS